MEFYRLLNRHYDSIFPYQDTTYHFLRKRAPEGCHVLDIGCATGRYLRKFLSDDYDAWGIEYVSELIRLPTRVRLGDMRKLPELYTNRFNFVYCIGNTLAHVENLDELRASLNEFRRVLKPRCKCIVQIVNYDRILSKGVRWLPEIKTSGFLFERKYDNLGDGSINFTGILSGRDVPLQRSETIKLYAITSEIIEKTAKSCGFNDIKFYGTFSGESYDPENSFSIICELD